MKRFFTFLVVLFFALPLALNAQSISGKVASAGEPIIGANLLVAGTSTGTITDIDGNYSLNLPEGTHLIEVTYTGYTTQTFTVTLGTGETKTMDVELTEGVSLTDVVVTGTRSAPRSSTDTPLPIDVVGADDLISTGQNSFEHRLLQVVGKQVRIFLRFLKWLSKE